MILITIINELDERLDLKSINGMSDFCIPMLYELQQNKYDNSNS